MASWTRNEVAVGKRHQAEAPYPNAQNHPCRGLHMSQPKPRQAVQEAHRSQKRSREHESARDQRREHRPGNDYPRSVEEVECQAGGAGNDGERTGRVCGSHRAPQAHVGHQRLEQVFQEHVGRPTERAGRNQKHQAERGVDPDRGQEGHEHQGRRCLPATVAPHRARPARRGRGDASWTPAVGAVLPSGGHRA